MSAAESPMEPPALDERDAEPRTPMKRLGSTRKLAAFSHIRLSLAEQQRALEARAEAAGGVAGELAEYCRRRADLEHEYARALDKLARAAQQKHKDQKHKRTEWALVGAYSCWQTALEQTRALARSHAALATLYAGRLSGRSQRAQEDAARLHRKCRDIVSERQEEVGGALAEAGAAGKLRAAAAAEWRAQAGKLRQAWDSRERAAGADAGRTKKITKLDKDLEKRRVRHSEARTKALRARADYLLCLEAANATLERYYVDDVADILTCMEVGFTACVGRAVSAAAAADGARAAALAAAARTLDATARSLDAPAERRRFLDLHHAFQPPAKPKEQGPPPDEEDSEVLAALGGAARLADGAAEAVGSELAARLQTLEAAARALRADCREKNKTLAAAERELLQQMEGTEEEWEVSGLFCAGAGAAGEDEAGPPGPPGPPGTPGPVAAPATPDPRKEQEDYYLAKFRSYMCAAGRLARLEGKAGVLRSRLVPALAPHKLPPPPPHHHPGNDYRGRAWVGGGGGSAAEGARGQFAAPLEEHLAATRRLLPTVLTSCVRVIATYGLRHQGIFRVSGSQTEMAALRAAFDRGLDPLARVTDAADINSVAGLLKMYLRELRPPLLGAGAAEALLRAARECGSARDLLPRMRTALAALPAANLRVLTYLFAFLHHLSSHADENMMDAWNLAICLGPTLLAARQDCGGGAGGAGGAQVAAQNLGNELVKRAITHHDVLFPQHEAPHALYPRERYAALAAAAAEAAAAGEELSEEERGAEGEDERDAGEELSEEERGVEGEDERDAGEELDDDDDDDEEEEDNDEDISDDCENGEWNDQDSVASDSCRAGTLEHRAPSPTGPAPAASQVATPPPAHPAHPAHSATPPAPPVRRLAEATPDLVLDLPARAAPAPATAPAPAAPASPSLAGEADSATMFLHNRDTLKKREPRHSKNPSSGSDVAPEEATAGAGAAAAEGTNGTAAGPAPDPGVAGPGADGSPVPARNTARVAAKFAELTLTGGSKPALAARPAPAPAPAAARPAPPARATPAHPAHPARP